jgi:hypothetical protein
MRHFLAPRWGWTSLCSRLPTAYAVGFILTPLCGWTPGFAHAFARLTPCGLHSSPLWGWTPGFAHASPRLTPWALFLRRFAAAPDRFLKNAAVRLFALAVENTSCLLSKCFVLAVENTSCLLPKCFVLAVENTSFLLPKCFALAVENTSLLMSKYFTLSVEIFRS